MIRKPVVAGQFYPEDKAELERTIDEFTLSKTHQGIAGVCPHAGYAYSGRLAATTITNMIDAETYVIVGPDHTGASFGETCIYAEGEWETPLGTMQIDEKKAKHLVEQFTKNEEAHENEHSIEVQLPILQKIKGNVKIIPIILGDQTQQSAVILGNALRQLRLPVIASSDFSHYVPADTASENDMYVIEEIMSNNVHGFYERVENRGVTACGCGCIAAAMTFADKPGQLLDYTTSGTVTEEDSVVGYASIIFE